MAASRHRIQRDWNATVQHDTVSTTTGQFDYSDNEFDDIPEEYENADDIESLRDYRLRQGLRCPTCNSTRESCACSSSSSSSGFTTTHTGLQQQDPRQPNNKKKPAPPPQSNKPRDSLGSGSYLSVLASDVDSGHSDHSPRSPVNISDLRYSHSDVDISSGRRPVPMSSSPVQMQRGHNSDSEAPKRARTLPVSTMTPNVELRYQANSPAVLHRSVVPTPAVIINRYDDDGDEVPSMFAPPPPIDSTGRRLPISSSSGVEASSSTPPSQRPASTGNQQKLKARQCRQFKTKEEDLSRFSWYKAWMSRDDASRKVRAYKEDGSFIVRNSHHSGPDKPYVLTILCRKEIFHVPIRQRADSYYAVGEKKHDELRFNTVEDVIKHFHLNAIDLLMPDNVRAHFSARLKYHE